MSMNTQTTKFNAGDTILVEGETGDSAFLIVGGSVEVMVGQGANPKKVATLSPGDVFGEMSLIDPGPRSATVKALTDTECVVTSYDEFMDLVKSSPEDAAVYMQTLVRRLRQMNEMMVKMDPGKRRLLDVFRDWATSADVGDENLSEEEKRKRMEYMYLSVPMF